MTSGVYIAKKARTLSGLILHFNTYRISESLWCNITKFKEMVVFVINTGYDLFTIFMFTVCSNSCLRAYKTLHMIIITSLTIHKRA